MRSPTETAPTVHVRPCGCEIETRRDGGERVVGKCAEGEALFAKTKRAGAATHDPKVKGGAKVASCREFDRRRAEFHEHVFGGSR